MLFIRIFLIVDVITDSAIKKKIYFSFHKWAYTNHEL